MGGSKKSEKRVERSSDPGHLGGLQLAPGDALDKIEAKEEVGEGRRGHGQSRLEKFDERQPGGGVLILVSVHGLCEGAKNSMGGVGGRGEGGEDGRLWLAGLLATMEITLTAARRAVGIQEP